tara:strand:- start:1915 stop:2031 length:117 start_codon:yes stop_codon:yes gene_type:complete
LVDRQSSPTGVGDFADNETFPEVFAGVIDYDCLSYFNH